MKRCGFRWSEMSLCPALQMEHNGYDEHQVRGDNVEAQHAREGRIQVTEVTQHFLPGGNESSRQSCLLLCRSQIQVRLIDLSHYTFCDVIMMMLMIKIMIIDSQANT